MKHYLTYDEFYNKIVNLPNDETIWRLNVESDDNDDYTLSFSKHLYEAEDGNMYPFVVYSYPKTIDAGIIQEHLDEGWNPDILAVWTDITEQLGLKPYEEVYDE